MKRGVLLILALSMMLSLAACGGSAAPGGSGDAAAHGAQPIELQYYMLSNTASGEVERIEAAVNEIIKPKLNATVNFIMVDYGSWDEKVNTALITGQRMDIIFTADWHNYVRQISMGLLSPLNDPNGPNGNLMEKYAPEAAAALGEGFIKGAQFNGINYGFPNKKELAVPTGYVFNKDLLEKYNLNLEDVKSEADLEPMLEIVRAGEPDITPYLTDGGWASTWIAATSQVGDIVMHNEPGPDGKDDGKIFLSWEDPLMREHIERMNRWYKAGYIHPDAALDTHSPTDIFNTGKFFAQTMPLKGDETKSKELEAASGNPDLHVTEKQIESPRYLTTHAGGSMLAIPVTSADPVRAMKFINEMHTNPELLNIMVWGVKDVNYTEIAPGVVEPNPNNSWVAKHAGPWTMGNQFLQYVGSNEDPEKYKKLQAFSDTGTPHISLGFRFDPTPVQNEIAAYNNALAGMSRGLRTGVIDVNDPKQGLDAAIAAAKAAGSDRILAEIQSQFDAWMKLSGK